MRKSWFLYLIRFIHNILIVAQVRPLILSFVWNIFLIGEFSIVYALPFTDQNMDEVRALFETNVFGVMTITQEFINLLIASEGLIVNIGEPHLLLKHDIWNLLF